MLGRHPQLYGFPELNLFLTETIGELWSLRKTLVSCRSSYETGLIRVIAELEFGGQTNETIQQASVWISQRSRWTTKQMFDELLYRIKPKIGIDKSPRTSLSMRAVKRALSGYPNARLIHLTRHPISTLYSLQQNHIRSESGCVHPAKALWLFDFYARLWIHSQQLILSALKMLDSSQKIHIRAEDLLIQPDAELRSLAEWLEVSADVKSIDSMKHPERSPYSKPAPMGLDGEGDALFMRSPCLRPYATPRRVLIPSEWSLDPQLVEKTDELSNLLGYGSIC